MNKSGAEKRTLELLGEGLAAKLIFLGVDSKRVENDHSTDASSRALGLENEGYALTLIFLKLNDETLPEEVEGKGHVKGK